MTGKEVVILRTGVGHESDSYWYSVKCLHCVNDAPLQLEAGGPEYAPGRVMFVGSVWVSDRVDLRFLCRDDRGWNDFVPAPLVGAIPYPEADLGQLLALGVPVPTPKPEFVGCVIRDNQADGILGTATFVDCKFADEPAPAPKPETWRDRPPLL